MVGRALSPVLRRELENLDKDADSRKSAMRALMLYVKDLDFKTIPMFLAQVSETKETGSSSGEFRISLYEVLARVHGVKIVPMIDNILQSIVQTLASSAGSFPLQQACSKVIPAIARYGIDPTTPEDKKRHIIHSLCKPLSDSLSSSQECLSSGAALCLKALVEIDNWRFASDEMVNKVCQNVAVALEGNSTQTNSHMGLVMALAKRNPLIVEAYARLLIQSGLRILDAGAELLEGNSQKRFVAIQMVNFLMKCLDPRSVFSEVEMVIEEMEKCQSDKMAYVKGAAFEALQTAKKVGIDKKPKPLRSTASLTASNCSRRLDMEGDNFSVDEDYSTISFSSESRTLDFFPGYESVAESPMSTNQPLLNSNYEQRSGNRKLWSQENGVVDVSLKDGLFSEARQINGLLEHSVNHELSNGNECFAEEFSGFVHRNQPNGVSKSTTTSPLRTGTHDDMSIKIFQTPKKLFDSFQDPDDSNSDCSERQNRRIRSLSGNIEWNLASISRYNRNGSADNVNYDDGEDNESLYDDMPFEGGQESVSSTDNLRGDADMQMPPEVVPENRLRKAKSKFVCGLSFVLVAMATPLLWINGQDEGHYLVPT